MYHLLLEEGRPLERSEANYGTTARNLGMSPFYSRS